MTHANLTLLRVRALCGLLPAALLAACETDVTTGPDAAVDAMVIDAGAADTGAADVPKLDAPVTDSGALDVGPPDVGPLDVGPLDVGPLDVGPLDVGLLDVGLMDVGLLDVGLMDVGLMDVGLMDAGPLDVGCAIGLLCEGVCVDTSTRADHCGACDAACPSGQTCAAGVCGLVCAAPLTVCGAGAAMACVDARSDARHCGACGASCPTGQMCVAGACGLVCTAPLTVCGAGAAMTCIDAQTDLRHCGGCGTVCPASSVCVAGACAATSCSSLHSASRMLPSGVYLLDSDGLGPRVPFRAYCDMTSDGGGWTLALKVDGTLPTFLYDAALWTNAATLNPTSLDLSTTEAKFESFGQIAFSSVRLVMRQLAPVVTEPLTRALVLPVLAESLLAAVTATGTPVTVGPLATSTTGLATTAMRDGWRALFESSGIQCNCGAQGFNVQSGARVRIGIFGNQENDCNTADSSAGVGHSAYSSGNNATGAYACGGDYTGDRATRTFSWVFVR